MTCPNCGRTSATPEDEPDGHRCPYCLHEPDEPVSTGTRSTWIEATVRFAVELPVDEMAADQRVDEISSALVQAVNRLQDFAPPGVSLGTYDESARVLDLDEKPEEPEA